MTNLFQMDFHELAAKADAVRKQMWGDKVFFVKNLHVNYTNICVSHCKFCAFAKDGHEDDAYFMNVDTVVHYVRTKGEIARELHIVGGLHPDVGIDYYADMISALHTEFPEKALKGFSVVEIDYLAKQSGMTIDAVLKRLKDAGLSMLPGGGAEILDEHVRNQICPEKISADEWLYIMEAAHSNGLKTNATMLYGHVETEEDRIKHLLRIRALQERTGGFSAFIPLAFHPQNTFLHGQYPATGIDDLKTIAVSRLVLDNVPHIKAYWVMLGEKTAQIALRFGADDLDGTIVKENITHAAGASSKEGLTEEELIFMIQSAGLVPVERDAFYNELRIYG